MGGELKEIAEDVVEVYQGELEGLVLFGSWVRGEASAASDIDLLLIMENNAVIDRDRYSHWPPRRVLGREVSPLFVHLPADTGSITGLWLEVAIDGIVLFDKTLAVSRFLAAARRMIAQGHVRLRAVDARFAEKLWADVVRESQEVVELALKGLIRYHHIEVPRVHDVSGALLF